ncbi:hypothetical protein Cgig2_012158 [Carnegiea gigantea]|uniref:Cyclin-like domain-containing protein n=1 Tax=Carnegiea gigantea TaxID=171969 RepID=A0A9Q1QNN6_9CARY|nr:hypothetical protein Cgig2_012158 [Carnegiea gigantea]
MSESKVETISNLDVHAMQTIATACMFLAGKVEETPRPLKDVILVSYEIIHKKDPVAIQKIKQKDVYEQQKELILLGERVVLATLGFDLNVQHPYKPLVEAIKKFKVAQHALAQVAWNFVNDGLRTSLCLQFKPHHIAAGAIFLAAKFLKVKLPSDGDKVWWQEFDVTPRQLEEVSNQMLELYEQNRAAPNQGSEAEGSVAGVAAIRPASRTSAEEQMPNGNASQVAAATKPGSLKPPIAYQLPAYQLPDQSNKHAGPLGNSQNYKAHVEPRSVEPVVHPENLGEGPNTGASADWNGSEDSKEKNNGASKPKERIDSKDKSHTSNLGFKETVQTQSPSEMVEKIDVNKLKEIREKRKKSRSDFVRKNVPMDEYDPIMKELEEGVELAAAESEKIKHEKKQNWSQPSSRLDNDSSHYSKHLEPSGDWHHIGSKGRLHGSDLENVDEGEVSALDDSSWDYQSPKSTDRKRKARSPSDIISDGKPWRDELSSVVGFFDMSSVVQNRGSLLKRLKITSGAVPRVATAAGKGRMVTG